VTTDTAPSRAPAGTSASTSTSAPAPASALEPDLYDHDGWQALAAASLGRLLTDTELAAVQHLPTELALDLLFPDLPDAARHEALWALG
jgi:hypothetical protein